MPVIKIADHLSADLVVANPPSASGLGKFLRSKAADLKAGEDLKLQLPKHLQDVSSGDNGFTLTFDHDIPLGIAGTALTVSAASTSLLGVFNQPGTALFERTFIGPPVTIAAEQAYVSLAFQPTLAVSLKQRAGHVSFGFDAGTDIELRCYRPFPLSGTPVTLLDACRESLEAFAIPHSAADLTAMQALPIGTIATVSGHGHLQFSGAADVAAAFNPLASVSTIASLGPLAVGGAAKASVGFEATVSGDWQMRVQRMAGSTIRLSYHTTAARELDVRVDLAAGPAVTLGTRDLLKMFFNGPGGLSNATEEDLATGGINAAQQKRLTTAMLAGMSRTLNLEVSAEISSARQHDAAFLYDIDMAALDAVGGHALDAALAGNLVELTRLEPDLPAHGIAVLQSRTQTIRSRPITWRINLVGLMNIQSLQELVRTGSVLHDEESGELIVTDKVSATRMGATTVSKTLRKLLFESVMLTATYKAGGLDPNTNLSAAQTFFQLDRRANRQRMSDYLDAVAALGLIAPADVAAALGTATDFGKASLLLETAFDQAACERLFSDAGAPRDRGFYEDVGKLALLALVREHDADAYRRVPLLDGALWAKMKDAGAARFRFVLPAAITGNGADEQQLHAEVVAADYSLIVWWAKAMAAASDAIADLRAYLAGPPQMAPDDQDAEFRARRNRVSQAMVSAVQQNRTTFGRDPWGLVAMFYASKRSGRTRAVIASSRLTRTLPE
jgi:hypothetical protein